MRLHLTSSVPSSQDPECLKERNGRPGVLAVSEAEFKASIPAMALAAIDNQNTGSNPRGPLVRDLERLLEDAYRGPILPIKTLEYFSSPKF